jgi:long-chain fatty acid transport protein
MGFFKTALLAAGSVGVLAALAGSAQAGGFAIREQSAEGLGSAFAGIAAGTDGLSGMFWNPATISQHNSQGYISESDFSGIIPESRAKNGSGFAGSPDSGNIGVNALVPSSYSVYGLTDELTVGMAITSPFGLTTNSRPWQGSLHGDDSDVMTMNFNPMVAYKPADWITLGAGVQGELMQVKLTSQTPGGVTVFRAKADDIGIGFTAGILLQPSDKLDIGLGFRSSVKHGLGGHATLLPAAFIDGGVKADLKTPETVTLGIKYDLNDQVKLMGGVEWANWSRFKDLTITRNDTGAVLATTSEKWRDSWFFSLGGEYAYSDALTLRAGAAYEKSPVPDATRTPRLPDNDRYWLSLGAGYKMNDWLTANLSYSHVFMKDGKVSLAPPPSPLQATFKQHLDIVAASAVIDW